ncbi:hypothetical protein [Oceanomicrobium pacificus]|uniref:Chemotaxis protein CheA n=1 Tax=Oceanomicrobium pacificus TaxID=2692916 RepID=A0A6B0TLV4_9RHOB|nr:hypothetical protein [Oceanomicrobium pacificus]MXU65530.1 hypothetical protein [Oceanomicrobium pacificus]
MELSQKKLTVAYGAFSCTLEGFDDPFPVMRNVVDYFQQLASRDPSFGAHPERPDSAYLAVLAADSASEADKGGEISAEVTDNQVVLRKSAASVTALSTKGTSEAKAEPMVAEAAAEQPAAPVAIEAAPEPEAVPEPQVDVAEGISAPDTVTAVDAAIDVSADDTRQDAPLDPIEAVGFDTLDDGHDWAPDPLADAAQLAEKDPFLTADIETVLAEANEDDAVATATDDADEDAALERLLAKTHADPALPPANPMVQLKDVMAEDPVIDADAEVTPLASDEAAPIMDEPFGAAFEAPADATPVATDAPLPEAAPAPQPEPVAEAEPKAAPLLLTPLQLAPEMKVAPKVEEPVAPAPAPVAEAAAETAVPKPSASPLTLGATERVTPAPARPENVVRLVQDGGRLTPARSDAGAANGDELRDFARKVGAANLPELLEASAAYMTIVSGQHQFSRSSVIRMIDQMSGEKNYSPEARIKSFGKLVRNGTILRGEDGQFSISDAALFSYETKIGAA